MLMISGGSYIIKKIAIEYNSKRVPHFKFHALAYNMFEEPALWVKLSKLTVSSLIYVTGWFKKKSSGKAGV